MLRERERVTKRKKLDHRGLGAGAVEVEPPVADEVLLDALDLKEREIEKNGPRERDKER